MSVLNLPTAPLWRRLAAMVYDLFNILGISFLLAAILIPLSSTFLNDGEPLGELPISVSASYFFIIIFFFYSTFWRRKRQTLGMKAWGLIIVNELQPEKQKQLSLGQCMLRIAIGFFSIGLAGFGFWWALWDKQEKTWHDHASFTRIVFNENFKS